MSADQRYTARRDVPTVIPVVDVLTGTVVGRIGNLCATGMQVVRGAAATGSLRKGALYQWAFALPGELSGGQVECGVEVMWSDQDADAAGNLIGARFILIDPATMERIAQWCAAA